MKHKVTLLLPVVILICSVIVGAWLSWRVFLPVNSNIYFSGEIRLGLVRWQLTNFTGRYLGKIKKSDVYYFRILYRDKSNHARFVLIPINSTWAGGSFASISEGKAGKLIEVNSVDAYKKYFKFGDWTTFFYVSEISSNANGLGSVNIDNVEALSLCKNAPRLCQSVKYFETQSSSLLKFGETGTLAPGVDLPVWYLKTGAIK